MRSNSPLSSVAPAAALLALLPCIAGCASSAASPAQKPVQTATASVADALVAQYDVPPALPHGEVQVATMGVTTLEPRVGQGPRVRAVHIRMVIHNQNDPVAWQVDTRAVLGRLDGYGQSRAILASATAGRPPVLSVGTTAKTTVDLYYPLPHDLQDASELPRFDVSWNVTAPAGPVVGTATFERVPLEPPPGVYAYGMGQYEWYDPAWPGHAFSQMDPLDPIYEAPPPVAAHIGL
jgi:hypothetical protein